MRFYKDNECYVSRSDTEFAAFLRKMKETTSWLVPSNVKDLKFSVTPGNPGHPVNDVEQDAIKDAIEENGIFININGQSYPVRDCAWQSIMRRTEIQGRAVHKLISSDEKEKACTVLNYCAAVTESICQPCIVAGKVNCLVSQAQGNGYKIIPQSEVFDETLQQVIELAGELPEEFNGYWTYSGICCKWLAPFLHEIEGTTFKTQVVLSTSDNGLGAITFRADLYGAGVIPLIDPIVIEHRVDRRQLTLSEAFDMLRTSIGDGVKKVSDLADIPISNPVSAVRNVAKKIKLASSYTEKVCLDYEATMPVNQTAFDCYTWLSKVLDLYEDEIENIFYHEKVKSNLLKALDINWSKYDYPSKPGRG